MTDQQKLKLEVLTDQLGFGEVLIALGELAEQRADTTSGVNWQYNRNARRLGADLKEMAKRQNPVLTAKGDHNESTS